MEGLPSAESFAVIAAVAVLAPVLADLIRRPRVPGVSFEILLGIAFGFALSELLIGLVLTTTAIGTLLPILRDREVLPTRFGLLIVAAGAVGEFGPMLAIDPAMAATDEAAEAVADLDFFAEP